MGWEVEIDFFFWILLKIMKKMMKMMKEDDEDHVIYLDFSENVNFWTEGPTLQTDVKVRGHFYN
jgi:hypothetical protein